MNVYVVDASFILQALLLGKSSVKKRFLELLTPSVELDICAPDFMQLEFRNGLRFSVSELDAVQDTLRIFSKLPISYLQTSRYELDQALLLSWKTKTTVYDSVYHVLALNKHATFVTCDRKYFAAAKSLGSIELVE